jgi:hypothetical protein
MSPIRERYFDGTSWLGWALETGWLDPWAGGANIGTLEPIGEGEIGAFGQTTRNVGAGLYEDRAFPTDELVVQTGVTYNSTTKRYTISVPIHDKVIRGFVTLTSTGELWNCHVAGPTVEYTGGYLAMVEGPTSGTALGKVYWTTVAPIVASAYYDGVGRGIEIWYSDIYDICDGVRGYHTNAAGARIHSHACDYHHAAQFRPDYANGTGRAETHNDVGVQCQGNIGTDDDISFDGCRINARHSLSKGTLPATRTQIAALMLTPQSGVGLAVHMRFDDGWLYGGMYCVNAGGNNLGDYGGSSLTIRNTRFERPGTNMFGDGRAPDRALAVDSSLTLVHSGNTYIDNGAPVVPQLS